jgi:hypothetical protein
MLPVAASRDNDGGNAADPSIGQRQCPTPRCSSAPLLSSGRHSPTKRKSAAAEERITSLSRDKPTLKPKGFRDAVVAELGESDPVKAAPRSRLSRRPRTPPVGRRKSSTKKANEAERDAILLKHEKRLTPAQKDYFGVQLMAELSPARSPARPKTEKVIESLPENKALGRKSAADGGKDAPTDRDARIQLRANELLEIDPAQEAGREGRLRRLQARTPDRQLRDPARRDRQEVITHTNSHFNRDIDNAYSWTQRGALPEHVPRRCCDHARRVVKRGADANHAVQAAAATDVSLGIAVDHQQNAERPLRVADRPGEVVWGEAGAAFALDALLTSDANGRLVTAATTKRRRDRTSGRWRTR